MCLIVGCLVLLGPRAAVIGWWLMDQRRWALTFDNPIVPILGFLILPWTTLMYVLVAPQGVEGIDVLGIIVAVLIDVGSWSGGGRQRNKLSRSGTSA